MNSKSELGRFFFVCLFFNVTTRGVYCSHETKCCYSWVATENTQSNIEYCVGWRLQKYLGESLYNSVRIGFKCDIQRYIFAFHLYCVCLFFFPLWILKVKSHSLWQQQQLFLFCSNVVCFGGNALTGLSLSLNTGQQITVILNGAGVRKIISGRLLFVLQKEFNQPISQSGEIKRAGR